MSENLPTPQDPLTLDDLAGPLRNALEHVRAEPVPQEALGRALDRARGLGTPSPSRWRRLNRRFWAVTSAAAAMLILGLFWGQRAGKEGPLFNRLNDSVDSSALRNEEIGSDSDVRTKYAPDLHAARPEPVMEWEATRVHEDQPLFGEGYARDDQTKFDRKLTTSPAQAAVSGAGESFSSTSPNVIGDSVFRGGTESAGIRPGAFKITENESPRPQDRKYLTYTEGQKQPIYQRNSDGQIVQVPEPDKQRADRERLIDKADKNEMNLADAEKTLEEARGKWETTKRLHERGSMFMSSEEIRAAQLTYEKHYLIVQMKRKIAENPNDLLTLGELKLKVAEKTRDEGLLRLEMAKKLRAESFAELTAEEIRAAQLVSEKYHLEVIAKQKALEQLRTELSKPSTDKKPPKPQVWRRNGQRPTFARVYLGDGNALELVSQHVTVTIEGPRARTLVDHVFRNPHDRQLEGTFEYPLPTGASASYFAMFLGQTREIAPPRFTRRGDAPPMPAEALARMTPAEFAQQVSTNDWGNLQEGRIVSKAKAVETYEDIVRGKIDPALLEHGAGNTFQGRVFPIPPKGYNRVLIAYEELLPYTQNGVQYRFPLPDCSLAEVQFTLNADAGECKEHDFRPAGAWKLEGGKRIAYSRTWTGEGPGGDVLFTYVPKEPSLQVISGQQGESGPLYYYARVRPELNVVQDQAFGERAVFLLDTSLSEDPDRFAVNVKLLRNILEADPAIKHFNILTFDVAGRWLLPKGWLDNTAAGRDKAFALLDGILLEGATNLSAALEKLADLSGEDLRNGSDVAPVNVFLLSNGQATWGETEVKTLVSRFESRCRFPVRFYCYRTGIGAENLELFEALVRRGGGIFNCFNEGDLPAAGAAHRRQCLQIERVSVVDGPETSDLLVAGRRGAVYPGGELIVAGRASQPGKVHLHLEGTFQGKPWSKKYPLEIAGSGELAARGWGEIAVASLLALNDPRLESLVTAYCQQFGIGSRVASFLILENAADYKRLDLEAERGKTVPGGDVGRFLDETWKNVGKALGPKDALNRLLEKLGQRLQPGNAGNVRKLLDLLEEQDFLLPEQSSVEVLMYRKDVAPEYLTARQAERRNLSPSIAEARRRADAGDTTGAVRVLSNIVEEYPGRADALRLAGYRLLDLKQSSQAARLFQDVQNHRPFEPHSYRDLARALEDCGCFGLAAVQYEILLAGAWHDRFRDSLKIVAQEEYVRMMRLALQQKALKKELAGQFGERLEQLSSAQTQSDLRVTISWNTDATDVDLWVIEPDGTKCFYSHNRTQNGGELTQDQTQGYGPERYHVAKAKPGEYTVIVHYYGVNRNLLAGETHVNVSVARNAGRAQEESKRYNIILKKHGEQVEVCRVKF